MLNFMEIFFALGVVLCQIFPFFTVTNEVAVQLLYQGKSIQHFIYEILQWAEF